MDKILQYYNYSYKKKENKEIIKTKMEIRNYLINFQESIKEHWIRVLNSESNNCNKKLHNFNCIIFIVLGITIILSPCQHLN